MLTLVRLTLSVSELSFGYSSFNVCTKMNVCSFVFLQVQMTNFPGLSAMKSLHDCLEDLAFLKSDIQWLDISLSEYQSVSFVNNMCMHTKLFLCIVL